MLTPDVLKYIFEEHKKWLYGKGGKRMCFPGANLAKVDFSGVDLSGADLREADLRGANFTNANLWEADLRGADLRGATLAGAILTNADLFATLLDNREKIRKGIILSEPLKGFMRCKNGVVAEIEVPEGAVVFSINNNKCRTNKAKVIKINGASRAHSLFGVFTYYEGDFINMKNFDMQYNVEDGMGIHFFRTLEEPETRSSSL